MTLVVRTSLSPSDCVLSTSHRHIRGTSRVGAKHNPRSLRCLPGMSESDDDIPQAVPLDQSFDHRAPIAPADGGNSQGGGLGRRADASEGSTRGPRPYPPTPCIQRDS